MRIAIVGAGAAGYFTALQLQECLPEAEVKLYEKATPLAKVKVSGGGRCNVTHACFEPEELIKYYPRGGKELLGPFHQWQPGDTIAWFAERGVPLKVEDDGRMFPETDRSQTIIDCFVEQLQPGTLVNIGVAKFEPIDQQWRLTLDNGQEEIFDRLVVTAGSSPKMAQTLKGLGISMVEAVPSLFTFHIPDETLHALSGLAFQAEVELDGAPWTTDGPMLITHWGASGPAVLKMSAWAARWMAERKYQAEMVLNSLPQWNRETVKQLLMEVRKVSAKKQVINAHPPGVTNRWWNFVVQKHNKEKDKLWADVTNEAIESWTELLTQMRLPVNGKSTFKEEFVTAGGVDLRSINFKSMESKEQKHLYFAGEVLDIDAVTGGFNFQAAWTTAVMAARGIAKSFS
jgi:predicted Rossmann fold flavoprotein